MSFIYLLEAQRDMKQPTEETLGMITKCGLHPSVRSYGAAGKHTEAVAFYDSLSVRTRASDELVSVLPAAAYMGDVGRVEQILCELEAANFPFTEKKLAIVSIVFREGGGHKAAISAKEEEAVKTDVMKPLYESIMRWRVLCLVIFSCKLCLTMTVTRT